MRPDAVSFTRTGCIVAMSEMVPSTMRPPCCGVGLAPAVALVLPGEPPFLDVAVAREGAWIETPQLLRHDEQGRRREAEVVGLLVVEQPVERVVALLPRRLAAVAAGRGARRVDGFVRVNGAEGAEVVAGRSLGHIRDRARVP